MTEHPRRRRDPDLVLIRERHRAARPRRELNASRELEHHGITLSTERNQSERAGIGAARQERDQKLSTRIDQHRSELALATAERIIGETFRRIGIRRRYLAERDLLEFCVFAND